MEHHPAGQQPFPRCPLLATQDFTTPPDCVHYFLEEAFQDFLDRLVKDVREVVYEVSLLACDFFLVEREDVAVKR